MKDFIPLAESEERTAQVEAGIRQFLAKEPGAEFDPRLVQSLRYNQGRSGCHAAVGRKHALNGEPVIAIRYEPGRDLYHVCTVSRGVLGGTPFLVGGWSVN